MGVHAGHEMPQAPGTRQHGDPFSDPTGPPKQVGGGGFI